MSAVRIRTAAELFGVLTTGSPMEQMAVLQSVMQNPEKPLSLGPHQGEDFIDLLLRLMEQSSGGLKQAQVVCLMCYQDERTTRFLVDEFSRCRDPALVLRLASRIGMERDIRFFLPFLWGEKGAQALAAARLCSTLPDLTPAERLRVAILLDAEFEPPALQEQTLDLWMKELTGRHRLRTRQLAANQPAGTLLLWSRWRELDMREQEWLITLTAHSHPGFFKARLPQLLEDPQLAPLLVTRALEQQVSLPACLLEHPQPEVRAAAIAQGHADSELERYLGPEVSLCEVLAALGRCSPERWVDGLRDGRWQVRGAAVQWLCQLECPPLEEVRRLSESTHLGAKVAALTVLEHLQG